MSESLTNFIGRPRPTSLTPADIASAMYECQAKKCGEVIVPAEQIVDGHLYTTAVDCTDYSVMTYALLGDEPYVKGCEEGEDRYQGTGQWYRIAAQGLEASEPFWSEFRPEALSVVDIDGDGDDDIYIQYEGGYAELALSVRAQLFSGRMYEDSSGKTMREDVRRWFEDEHGKVFACYPKNSGDLFTQASLFFRLMGESNDVFDSPVVGNQFDTSLAVTYMTAEYLAKSKELIDTTATRKDGLFYALEGKVDPVEGVEGCKDIDCKAIGEHMAFTHHTIDWVAKIASKSVASIGSKDGGIGISFGVSEEGENAFVIKEVVEGGPADAAGLKVGDEIAKVAGIDLKGSLQLMKALSATDLMKMKKGVNDVDVVREMIVGPSGTAVEITVKREGKELAFNIKRGFNLMPYEFKRVISVMARE